MPLQIKIIKNGGVCSGPPTCQMWVSRHHMGSNSSQFIMFLYLCLRKKGKGYCKAMCSCSSVNPLDWPEKFHHWKNYNFASQI